MKTFVYFILAAGALTGPALSFAQTAPGHLTRAQVIDQLVEVERAGYYPGTDDVHYPEGIQSALAKIAAQSAQQAPVDSVGGIAEKGSSDAGAPHGKDNKTAGRSIYFGQ
jgi:hypothetical protein